MYINSFCFLDPCGKKSKAVIILLHEGIMSCENFQVASDSSLPILSAHAIFARSDSQISTVSFLDFRDGAVNGYGPQ